MSDPESASSATSEKPQPAPVGESGIRWGGGRWIVGIFGGLFLIVLIGSKTVGDDTFIGTVFTACCLLGGFFLAFWWLFFSRAPWKIRLGAVVGAVAFASLFEIKGFSGNFVPTVAFRWRQPVRVERPAEAVTAAGYSAQLPLDYQPVETDWPEFRGANRDGIFRGAIYSESWLEPPLQWRIPIGEGWSSFCVVGPLAFTQWQEGEAEVTVCLDAATGVEIWRREDPVRFGEAMGGPGPRATPTFADGRLFVLGATGVLNCLNPNTGQVHWSVNILDDANAENIQWAMSGSPLIMGGRVIVSPGGPANSSLVAYDADSGERVWRSGDAVASYSSPQRSTIGGVEQILIFNGEGVHAHDPADGAPLWNFPFTTSPKICVAQPGVFGENAVLLSLGYGVGSVLLDVTMKDGVWTANERWKSRKLKSKFNDFVIRDGYAYGIDEGGLACVDLSTGERAWKGMRCGYGQLLLVEEVLVVLSEKGEVIYVKADPGEEFVLGRFKAIDGKTWNHPVIAGGRLFVRNAREAACFGLDLE
jgi:outer membrane protein assembly factor BamB